MTIRVLFNNILPQSCGVGEIGIFRKEDIYNKQHPSIATVKHKGGCDWVIAGFTPSRPDYEEAYAECVKRWGQPLFRSPVRKNSRTDNMFFFCIWDTKGKK